MPPSPSCVVELETNVASQGDVAVVQVRARRVAAMAGLPRKCQIEFAIAASEAATNLLAHAGSGTLTLRVLRGGGAELEAVDQGTGIRDVDQALTDGVSKGLPVAGSPRRNGLGSGLGAIRRLSDDLRIETSPLGTRVTARKTR